MASNSAKPRLEIRLGEPNPAYRCGRDLTGTLVLDCHGGYVHLTRLFVECLGYSEVSMEVGASSQKRVRREHLSIKNNLLPPNSGQIDSRRFEFKFRLPVALPHSVECDEIGFIRYCCRAIACLESSDQLEAVAHFSLIEEVDLNSELVQQACRPAEQASASVVQKISGRSGKEEVKAALVLARSAYVPGENVECTLSIHCASLCINLKEQAIIRLVQKVSASGENGRTAHGPEFTQAIVQERVQADEQYSEHFWSARSQFHIPGSVASTLPREGCPHPLTVSYSVEISINLVFPASSAKELVVSCPVVVGTVPLLDAIKAHQGSLETSSSLVEVCRCVISDTDHHSPVKDKYTRTGSFIGQLMGNGRRKTSFRTAPPIQYTLYCIYYPLISQIKKKKGTKGILKRHSVDNSLDNTLVPGSSNQEQLVQASPRTGSVSLYETQL